MKKIWIVVSAGLLCLLIVLGIIGKIFSSQWNYHGISKYLNVKVDDNQGLKLVKENEGVAVYTYNMQECNVGVFLTGHSIPLKDVVFEKIGIDEMTDNLQVGKMAHSKVYEAENYKICFIDNNVVISDTESEIAEIIEAVDKFTGNKVSGTVNISVSFYQI